MLIQSVMTSPSKPHSQQATGLIKGKASVFFQQHGALRRGLTDEGRVSFFIFLQDHVFFLESKFDKNGARSFRAPLNVGNYCLLNFR